MDTNYESLFQRLNETLWELAEPKFEEYRSTETLTELFRQEGFQVQEGLAGIDTAFSATYGSGSPVIGILGEYDALFGMSQEADRTEPCPRPGRDTGHGCGHCQLGTAAAGAVLMIRDYLRKHNGTGTVIFFGCPAEEGGSGKTFMARSGCFDKLDAALTWHPANANFVMTGSFQANCQAYFRFKGISSHAASTPHLGRSALDAVELMNVGANYMREHIEPGDCFHYATVDTGGGSPNVVQAHAEVVYLIRSTTSEKVEELYRRICNIAKGAALMTETDVEVIFDKACSNYCSNRVLEQLLYDQMIKIGVPTYSEEDWQYAQRFAQTLVSSDLESDQALSLSQGLACSELLKRLSEKPIADFICPYQHSDGIMLGSSDVGDVSHVVPTAQFMAACAVPGTPGHSWQRVAQGKSSIALKGMLFAANVLSSAAQALYEDSELVQKAKQEFQKTIGGQPYCCPIPDDILPNQRWKTKK